MKKTMVINPIKTSLVSQEPVQSGKRFLECSTESDFTINIIKEGSSLNSSLSSFYLKTFDGQPGGEPRRNLDSIPEGGLVPSLFSESFNFLYSFSDPASNKERWIGKNGFGAKYYKNFNISEVANNFTAIDLDNGFMFEHNSELFFVSEKYTYLSNDRITKVNLYKYEEGQNSFFLYSQFDSEPVNTIDTTVVTLPIPKNQYGSPVGLSFNGRIHIAYRVVNNATGSCHISLYRQLDDGITFEKISETPMINAPNGGYYDDFRLRLVQGCDILMIVSYGIVTLYRDSGTAYPYCVRDFRTYCSFDGGFNFNTKSQGIKNVLIDPSSSFKAITQRSDYNASTLLFPEFISNSNEEDYASISVKFDLYFDETVGRFVLVKGGDPFVSAPDDPEDPANTLTNANNLFLMGICSSPETPFDWESLFKYPLVASNIGYVDDTAAFVPLDLNDYLEDTRSNALYIEDVKVVYTPKENYIFIIAKNANELGHQDFTTCVSRFKLVEDRYVPKGFYNKIFAYGTKGHPNISFCCDVFNHSTSSLFSNGDFNGGFGPSTRIDVTDITASTYRNQVVATCRTSYNTLSANAVSNLGSDIFGNKQEAARYRFLSFFSNYSNLGDDSNYELCWPIAFQRPDYFFGIGENIGSTAVTTYNASPNGFVSFAPLLITDRKYINIGRSSPYGFQNQKTFAERVYENYPDNGFMSFKVKMQAAIFNMTGSNYITVMDINLNDGIELGLDLQLRMTASGALELFDSSGFLGGYADGTLTQGEYYDLYLAVGFNTSGQTTWGASISFKPISSKETEWNPPVLIALTPSVGSLGYHFHIGLAGLQTYEATMRVEIGSILASSGSQGYYPIFKDLGVLPIAPGESSLNDINDNNVYIQNSIPQIGTTIALHDGSVIEILGPPTAEAELTYSLSLARPLNSVKNTHSQNSTYGHDFTDFYDNLTKYSLLFRKDNYEPFNSCGLFNLIGVTEIEITCGEYDTVNEVFLASSSLTFEIPHEVISYTEYVDNYIITNENYSTHELKGKYIYVEESLSVTKQLLIIDNYDGIIEVDEDLNSLMTGAIFKIYQDKVYFNFDENCNYTTFLGLADHIEVTFTCPVLFPPKLRNVGQISFGNIKEFSEIITGFSLKDSSNYSPVKTDRGYTFNSINRDIPITREISIDMSSVSKTNQEYELAVELFSNLKKENKQFPIITIDNEEKQELYYGQLETFSISRSGNEKNVSGLFKNKDYKINTSNEEIEAPFILTYALDTDLAIGENVNYYCIVVGPPGVTYTYEWVMGDGYVYPISASNAIHNYAANGNYITTVTITGTDGFLGERKFLTLVRPPEIDNYQLTIDNASSPKVITLTARDKTGTIVSDNSTVVELIPVNANALANQYDNYKVQGYDGLYNSVSDEIEIDDLNTRLQNGLSLWRINPSTLTTGLCTFKVRDTRNRIFDLSVTVT